MSNNNNDVNSIAQSVDGVEPLSSKPHLGRYVPPHLRDHPHPAEDERAAPRSSGAFRDRGERERGDRDRATRLARESSNGSTASGSARWGDREREWADDRQDHPERHDRRERGAEFRDRERERERDRESHEYERGPLPPAHAHAPVHAHAQPRETREPRDSMPRDIRNEPHGDRPSLSSGDVRRFDSNGARAPPKNERWNRYVVFALLPFLVSSLVFRVLLPVSASTPIFPCRCSLL